MALDQGAHPGLEAVERVAAGPDPGFPVDAAAVLEGRESLDPFPVVAFGVEDDGAGLRQFFFLFSEVLEHAEILQLLFDFTRSDID